MNTELRDFEQYAARVRPYCVRMFNLAHVITGSSETAEYCLQCSLLDHWLSTESSSSSTRTFYESLRELLLRNAMHEAGEAGEQDWEPADMNADSLLMLWSKESTEIRRVLLLRFGVSLSPRQIARLTEMKPGRVAAVSERFLARCGRRLKCPRRRAVSAAGRSMKEVLSVTGPKQPEPTRLLASLRADVMTSAPPNRLPVRILKIVLTTVLAIVCMVMFWFASILMQPAVLHPEAPPAQTEPGPSQVP